eukprot:scaffold4.g4733.t1
MAVKGSEPWDRRRRLEQDDSSAPPADASSTDSMVAASTLGGTKQVLAPGTPVTSLLDKLLTGTSRTPAAAATKVPPLPTAKAPAVAAPTMPAATPAATAAKAGATATPSPHPLPPPHPPPPPPQTPSPKPPPPPPTTSSPPHRIASPPPTPSLLAISIAATQKANASDALDLIMPPATTNGSADSSGTTTQPSEPVGMSLPPLTPSSASPTPASSVLAAPAAPAAHAAPKTAGYSSFGFQVTSHADKWDATAQDAFKSAFAQQVGIQPSQVALSSTYQVTVQLTTSDIPGNDDVRSLAKAVAAYLNLTTSNVTFTPANSNDGGSSGGSGSDDASSGDSGVGSMRKLLKKKKKTREDSTPSPSPKHWSRSAPASAPVHAPAPAPGLAAAAVPGTLVIMLGDAGAAAKAAAALQDSQALAAGVADRLGQTKGSGLKLSMQSAPTSNATTEVNATLTVDDVAAKRQDQIAQAASSESLQRLLAASGVGNDAGVAVTEAPQYVAKYRLVSSPGSSSRGGSSSGMLWGIVGGVVGGVVLVAAVAAVFLVRRRRKRATAIEASAKRIKVINETGGGGITGACPGGRQHSLNAVASFPLAPSEFGDVMEEQAGAGTGQPIAGAYSAGAAPEAPGALNRSSGGVAAFLRRVTQGRSKEEEEAGAGLPPLAVLLGGGAASTSLPSSGNQSFTSTVLPPGEAAPGSVAGSSADASGGRPAIVPPLPLPVLQPGAVQDPDEAFQLGVKAAIAQMAAAAGMDVPMPPGALSPVPSAGQRTPAGSGFVSPVVTSRSASVSMPGSEKLPRGERSARGKSSARKRRTPRVWSAEEEEANDTDFPMGATEQPHARMPGQSALSSFRSQRQRPERDGSASARGDGGLTPEAREVLDRTAGLLPGQQFQKYFWMTEGVRVTPIAVVRNAVHKVTKQPVNIKFFGKVDDFRREAALYNVAVSHQFVPVMYYAEEGNEDLPPFLILEKGDFSLADALARSRPPPQQQKILLHDAVAALAHLHSLGVVLTDLTPASLMFFGSSGCWKVVAADVAGRDSLVADPAVDLWSLGVIAYEVVTGQRYFEGLGDKEVMGALLGHRLLPSEGSSTCLAAVTDRTAQRLLRHLVRRGPTNRWDTFRVITCQWLHTSDFNAYRKQ